jgi:hypothetical protein
MSQQPEESIPSTLCSPGPAPNASQTSCTSDASQAANALSESSQPSDDTTTVVLPKLGNGKRDLTCWIWDYGLTIGKPDGDYWRCSLCK